MDVWQFIARDHANIAELFVELTATGAVGAVDREKLFGELKAQLEAHAEMEENVFYPALTSHGRAEQLLPQAIEDHEEMQRLLAELDEEPKEGRRWTATLLALRQLVQEHVRHEESEMIPAAQRIIPGGNAERRLLHRMIEEKRNFLAAAPAATGVAVKTVR